MNRCPDCGTPLPLGEVGTLCSRCLINAFTKADTFTADASPLEVHPLIRELNGYFEEFDIVECIGRGGMGAVYRARQRSLNRQVAIKILPFELQHKSDLIERFRREAETMARINDPRIVAIFDYGEVGGLYYIAMELLEGGTFASFTRERSLGMRDGIQLLTEVCRGVQVLHGAGIIHRDIKPSNIMIRAGTGAPVLMDFGLAKDTATHEPSLTLTGNAMGTPSYMAPEQAAGKRDAVSPSTDVWSLGAMLYEIVSGHPPFTGTTAEIIHRLQNEEAMAPTREGHAVSRDLQTICLKALARDPRDRYPDANELADDLESYLGGREIKARPVGSMTKVWRKAKRRPLTVIAVLLGLFLIGLTCISLLKASGQKRLADERAKFDAAIENNDWSPGAFAAIEGHLSKIGSYSVEEAAAMRLRLAARYGRFVSDLLDRPRLDPGELEAAASHVDRLNKLDPVGAARARERLTARTSDWQDVVLLTAPFDGLAKVVSSRSFRIDGEKLVVNGARNAELAPSQIEILSATSAFLEVELALTGDWSGSSALGVAMSEGGNEGYTFWLRHLPEDEGTNKPSALDVESGFVVLEILRDGSLLARSVIPSNRLPRGPLTLTARRAGARLTLGVTNLETVSYEDLFPSPIRGSGRIKLMLNPESGVTKLRVSRRGTPLKSSPLETGDDWYLASRFDKALASYREQHVGNLNPEQAQEVQVKEALCLLELGRKSDAKLTLERVSTLGGDRWPIIAGLLLWRQNISDGDMQAADAIFEVIAAKRSGRDLTEIIPFQVRQDIVKRFLPTNSKWNFDFSDESVARLESWLSIVELISRDAMTSMLTRWELMRALHARDEKERALTIGMETIRIWGLNTSFDEAHEVVWLLSQLDRGNEALRFIDDWRSRTNGTRNATEAAKRVDLLIARSMVLAGMGRLDEALADFTRWEAEFGLNPYGSGFNHTRACLLGGFIHEQRGERDLAKQWWEKGLHANRSNGKDITPSVGAVPLNGFEIINSMMLVSLSGTLDNDTAAAAMGGLVDRIPEGSPAAYVKSFLKSHPEILSRVWQDERARKLARDYAYGKLSYRGVLRALLGAIAVASIDSLAFKGGATADQKDVSWDTSLGGVDAWLAGRISQVQLGMLLANWKGIVTFWPQQKRQFPEEFRANLGYLLAVRLKTLGKTEDARRVLEGAIEDAPDDRVRNLSKRLMEDL